MAEWVERAETGVPGVSRGALVRLAYRLLGSVEDAEDVVQDAHLKLLAGDYAPDDPAAYLFRTVTNLAIDRLRRLKVQRRAYVGPWLPEPLATEACDGEQAVGLSDDLSMGFLLLLERLSVSERIAFVLREAFGLDFNEMAAVLDVRADACRQRYHRARRKLEGARRPATPPARQRKLIERLTEVVLAGDREALTRLLAEDAVLLTDGGGRVSAAVRPVEGAERIAQVLLHLAGQRALDAYGLAWVAVNGGVGLLLREGGGLSGCIQVEAAAADSAEAIARIYVVRHPDKLARLAQSG